MKLLINIDQKGSLAAGVEAPNSWEPFNLPVKAIPADIRPFIAENYNPATFKLNEPTKRIPMPLNEEKVIAWLTDYHKRHLELAEKKRQEEEETAHKIRAAAEEVLAERKTHTRSEAIWVEEAQLKTAYSYQVPAWPHGTPQDILQSAKALRWQLELDEEQAAAKETAVLQAIETARTREARKVEEKRWIADWVELYGTKSQKERLAEGLLPQSEIEDAVIDQCVPVHRLPKDFTSPIEEISELPPQAWNSWKVARERVTPLIDAVQFLYLTAQDRYAAKLTIAAGPLRLDTIVVL